MSYVFYLAAPVQLINYFFSPFSTCMYYFWRCAYSLTYYFAFHLDFPKMFSWLERNVKIQIVPQLLTFYPAMHPPCSFFMNAVSMRGSTVQSNIKTKFSWLDGRLPEISYGIWCSAFCANWVWQTQWYKTESGPCKVTFSACLQLYSPRSI